MGSMKSLSSKFGILGELVVFLWYKKLWWLIPIIVVLVLFALLFATVGSSTVAPFIYSLF